MNLTFFNTKDEIPKHSSQVVFINYRYGYLGEYFEFCFGRIEYFWDNGNGGAICYDENDPDLPESDDEKHPFQLCVLVDGQDFGIYADKNKPNKIDIFWAYYDDIFDTIKKSMGSD